jgi:hypothetical protein
MSDTPQAPDWWLASDGRYYPPPRPGSMPPPVPGTTPPQFPAQFPPQQRPPVPPYGGYQQLPPARPNSGFAIASLILGLVWFCGIGSVLAIIFGAIGLKETKPPEGKNGRGLAIAGLILGVLGAVSTIGLVVVLVAASDQITESIGTVTEIDDVTITACSTDPTTGVGIAEVVIVNDSSKTSDYVIDVRFADANGDETVGRTFTGVGPDERITTDVRSTDPIDGPFFCVVDFVDRTATQE